MRPEYTHTDLCAMACPACLERDLQAKEAAVKAALRRRLETRAQKALRDGSTALWSALCDVVEQEFGGKGRAA